MKNGGNACVVFLAQTHRFVRKTARFRQCPDYETER
jgi:hypothetical protein